MSIRIQIASDIHLEHDNWHRKSEPPFERIITPHCPVLILAGDIGNPGTVVYRKFLRWCASKFTYVFLTPGNHEYFGKTIEEADSLLEEICHDAGVVLLNNRSFSIPGLNLTFIGATLWSHIPQEAAFESLMYVSDFTKIKDMSMEAYNLLHANSREWLTKTLSKVDSSHRKIVVSHHAPLLEVTSHPVFRGKKTNFAFQSDCTEMMQHFDIDVWFFGHTHYSVDLTWTGNQVNTSNPEVGLTEGETRVVSNQRGYNDEAYSTHYAMDKFVELKVQNKTTGFITFESQSDSNNREIE